MQIGALQRPDLVSLGCYVGNRAPLTEDVFEDGFAGSRRDCRARIGFAQATEAVWR
jgi:hypothetical protein